MLKNKVKFRSESYSNKIQTHKDELSFKLIADVISVRSLNLEEEFVDLKLPVKNLTYIKHVADSDRDWETLITSAISLKDNSS